MRQNIYVLSVLSHKQSQTILKVEQTQVLYNFLLSWSRLGNKTAYGKMKKILSERPEFIEPSVNKALNSLRQNISRCDLFLK